MKKIKFGKNTSKFILGLIVASILYILFTFNDAAPGGALYGIDRWVEGVQMNMTNSTEGKIRLHLKLAQERLDETKLTSRDTDATKMLMQDFANNLDSIVFEYTESAKNETLSTEKLTKLGMDLIKIHAASYGRSIGVRFDSTSQNAVRSEINRGYNTINRFSNGIFDAVVNNIEEGDYEFEIFVKNMLAVKNREIAQSVKFMEEDSAILTPQLSPSQLEELTTIVEEIRQEFFDVRDKIDLETPKDFYKKLKDIQRKIDEEFSPTLVRLSKESARIPTLAPDMENDNDKQVEDQEAEKDEEEGDIQEES
jgi:hypothetical protein